MIRSSDAAGLAMLLAAASLAAAPLPAQTAGRDGFQAEASFRATTLVGGAYPHDEIGLGAQSALRRVWTSGVSLALGGIYAQPEDLSLDSSDPRRTMEEYGVHAELRYEIPDLEAVRPYAAIRAGWKRLRSEGMEGAAGSGPTAGLLMGVEVWPTDRFGFRLNGVSSTFRAPGLVGTADNSGQAWSLEAGVAYFFGSVTRDADGDGVDDSLDACPGTPRGLEVDRRGCPPDSDGDGRADLRDACPDTPRGVAVDARGCAADADDDGVPDARDGCAGTERGLPVDEQGCVADADSDGVHDRLDACPDTPSGNAVDARGCSLDADADGVSDSGDRCPDTLAGTEVNAEGCSEVQAGLREGRFTLRGLPFRFKAVQVNEQLEERLEQIGSEMLRNRGIRLEIRVHTDTLGPASYNREMSQRLAESARDYLLGRYPELGSDRVEAVGMGEEPSGEGEEAAASRVVFVVRSAGGEPR